MPPVERSPESPFTEVQRRHFESADGDHFEWSTAAPGFAETEDELLAPVLDQARAPCLEMGCGEGNNLLRLARQVRCVGVDFSRARVRYAAGRVGDAQFSVSDAAALPFPEAAFQSVLIRDLLHHVPDPGAVLAEAVRVLAAGGTLFVLEPNALNPLVRLQTWIVSAEAGARDSTAANLERLLAALEVRDIQISMHQPFQLRRLLLHYRFGLPRLGRFGPLRSILARAEQMLGLLMPKARYAYIFATLRRN